MLLQILKKNSPNEKNPLLKAEFDLQKTNLNKYKVETQSKEVKVIDLIKEYNCLVEQSKIQNKRVKLKSKNFFQELINNFMKEIDTVFEFVSRFNNKTNR